jgi:predicted TPR repeat methyltransferase
LDSAGIFAFSTEGARFTDYRLKKNGRFAHSPKYIVRIAKKNGLTVLARDKIKLRLEHHQWVKGDLFLLGGMSLRQKQGPRSQGTWKRFGRFLFTDR